MAVSAEEFVDQLQEGLPGTSGNETFVFKEV